MAFNVVLQRRRETLQNFTLVNLVLVAKGHLAENFDSIDQGRRKFDFFHPLVQVLSAHQLAWLAFVEFAEIVRCFGAWKRQNCSSKKNCRHRSPLLKLCVRVCIAVVLVAGEFCSVVDIKEVFFQSVVLHGIAIGKHLGVVLWYQRPPIESGTIFGVNFADVRHITSQYVSKSSHKVDINGKHHVVMAQVGI